MTQGQENPAVGIGKNVVSGVLGSVGKGLLTGKGLSLSTMFGPALPFTALAGFVVPKIIQSIIADKPRITFSGVDPKYQIPDNPQDLRGYSEFNGKVTGKGGKSQKYDYVIAVKDTGKDEEIAQALIQQYDAAFDALVEQGVPVNEMLRRNKGFISTGRVDKGLTPETMFTNVMTHLAPDVNAYKSGQAPPPREFTVKPAGISRNDEYDSGTIRNKYKITLDNDDTKVQADGMKPIDMVRNPNLTPADLLAATGGTSQADLDALYARALAGDPKSYAQDDYQRRVQNFQGALAGKGSLRNIPGTQDWFANYAQNREKIYSQAVQQAQTNPVPQNTVPDYSPKSRFNAQDYLSQNPDIAQGGYTEDTAYDHYDTFGKNEARPGSPLAVGEYSFEDAETARQYFQNYKPDDIRGHIKAAGGTEAQMLDVANRSHGESWTEEDMHNYLNPAPEQAQPSGLVSQGDQRRKTTGLIARQDSIARQTPAGGPAHDWWSNR